MFWVCVLYHLALHCVKYNLIIVQIPEKFCGLKHWWCRWCVVFEMMTCIVAWTFKSLRERSDNASLSCTCASSNKYKFNFINVNADFYFIFWYNCGFSVHLIDEQWIWNLFSNRCDHMRSNTIITNDSNQETHSNQQATRWPINNAKISIQLNSIRFSFVSVDACIACKL